MRVKYESEFFMTEQQIYKWWWDQTRKRSKKAIRKTKGSTSYGKDVDDEHHYEGNSSSPNTEDGEMIVSFQDEFGGYSSRLRIDSSKKRAASRRTSTMLRCKKTTEETMLTSTCVNYLILT